MNIHRSAQRKPDHAGADGLMGQLIDNDESAQPLILGVGSERDGTIEAKIDRCDFIQAQRLGCQMGARVNVEVIFDVGDADARSLAVNQRCVGTPGQHDMLAHPEQIRLELVSGFDRM